MASLAVVLCALTVTAGCGSDSDAGSGSGTDPLVIEVTISGDSVTPNGERVEVAVGQEIQLEVTADEAGEIHVHSSPEQELEYEAGTHTVTIQGIDKPGTVDVESHSLEKVIVQLEVS
ncbi:uncharacterized protein (Precursor) [Nocardioides sp. PD653]|nr:uncharacterized protein (Precursor) [Nocardioides sp. PD653-B2]GAW57541.1 uncharacterized protein (Precursor) [Nocardioides sp. PD653]